MKLALIFLSLASAVLCQSKSVAVLTTSGVLEGVQDNNGVRSFKGIRYGVSPTGELRWEPPVPFFSARRQNATTLGPSCVQQFAFAVAAIEQALFNNPGGPPPPESEDCLFLNVWAPGSGGKKPVVVWIHGGSLAFGTASLPAYDGTSIATNQDVIIVTINYRTNVFGFPGSPDLPIKGNNLGFLDQELALKWVQLNIANFGGDPKKVTIMGQSAGSSSVSAAVVRSVSNPPFRAAIMLSGALTSRSPAPSFTSFNALATGVNCTQAPGPKRLQCLKNVPTAAIKAYIDGPTSGSFSTVVDNSTIFDDPLERIRTKQTARVPVLLGNMQDDGDFFTLGQTNLTAFLQTFAGGAVPVAIVRALYPGLSDDSRIIAEVFKDVAFLCPAGLWSNALVGSGISSVFRYTYGAVFPDLQVFPNAGAWHGTELLELFGTYNRSTVTPAEVTLSQTWQTAFANFIKNPNADPSPEWVKYVPGNTTKTLARIAYNGNVDTNNFVELAESDSIDGPCAAVWNKLLDFRP
ncbi:alpha/beta-hydrolase [Rickenella mellea]|uniref:Carboxylic ester hydrolase n=1 Tax=Rickenella mellea TaxID=50990 RepID=A0A4Y7PXD6_9AGAM|nr:alpha/beta-hydrolase [Rickenella mellea]